MKKFEECLSILKSIKKNISRKEFANEPFYYSTGERNLHLAIEILLDISNFVISRAGFRQPGSNSEIIEILAEQKIIPIEFAKRIEKLPAFRNLLVHEYLILDREIVYDKIVHSLDDLESFAGYLTGYLKL